MARSKRSDRGERAPLRERIRAAGGLYRWVNTELIRVAGPASVGPYDAPAEETPVAARACPLCGAPMSRHTVDRSGPRTLLHCPSEPR